MIETGPDPASRQEWMDRYDANHDVSGSGDQTMVHVPCPFCAAPDWIAYLPATGLLAALADEQPRRCDACGRAGIVLRTLDGGLNLELVQTGGPDVPDWFDPAPRRIGTSDAQP